ncbi:MULTISPECIES: hypothetical protein [Bacillaceae]|uniref:hypothetical protein n=1 Tax=Bacillales TaxID=1385 RepID=UPI0018841441|nr:MULTISPECIES: hypothetical protein [Bacillaceae]MBF0708957.1 hypothetical protein [Pseudalkalibacillus hwajinpoensis]MDO6655430.1 hypothetical protein [Anaerobacillus sp. 1_MG-2023]
MFDPTIYENVKVVLEGELYDRDLDGEISIINRKDLVDLASLSRKYQVEFSENEHVNVTIELFADLANFSAEQLKLEHVQAGCEIKILFDVAISDAEDCEQIEEDIRSIWGYRPAIRQTISFPYEDEEQLKTHIVLEFNRRINEDQISDLSELIAHAVQTSTLLGE